jgi:hypothetical protein
MKPHGAHLIEGDDLIARLQLQPAAPGAPRVHIQHHPHGGPRLRRRRLAAAAVDAARPSAARRPCAARRSDEIQGGRQAAGVVHMPWGWRGGRDAGPWAVMMAWGVFR